MSPEQIVLARHALGFDNTDAKCSYRNRYFAPDTGSVREAWDAMVAIGDAVTNGRGYFQLTRRGAQFALKPGERLDPEDFQP